MKITIEDTDNGFLLTTRSGRYEGVKNVKKHFRNWPGVTKFMSDEMKIFMTEEELDKKINGRIFS
jgi:hypothetical protein